MKKLICVILLLLAGTVQAAPPKLTVLPNGELQIVAGGTVLTVKADGSVVVKSPAIDLTIPGTDGPAPGPGPVPPGPAPDRLESSLKALYGAIQETNRVKDAKALAGAWRYAADVAESKLVNTPADIMTLWASKGKDLSASGALGSIQERIEVEVDALFPDQDKALTQEQRDQASKLFRKIAAILEALPNG
jgi:hypothetical protein